MQLQNGYDVSELTSRPHHHQLLPPDHPTGYPLPPPNQQHPQFQLFWQQQQQQPQPPSVNVDPFALDFRAGMGDPRINAAAGLAPPPSVVVAPQALRWINHQEEAIIPKHPPPPLWRCESESIIGIGHPRLHKSVTELQISATPNYTQFGDQYGSKPEFEKQYSQSPGSTSEIYESTQWTPNPEIEAFTRRGICCTGEATKKKKKKHKFCTDSELKVMAGLIEAQLVAHQERLHARFAEAIERMDRARKEREDTWRAADAQAARAQAADRAREQALASTREAVIVSYLEKMTGERIELPTQRAEVDAFIGSRTGLAIRKPGPKSCKYFRNIEDDCDVQYSNSVLYNDNAENISADCETKNVLLEAMLELEESNAQPCQLNHKDDHDGENLTKDCDE